VGCRSVFVIKRYSYHIPRVEKNDTETGEVLYVAGDERKAMFKGRGGYDAVHKPT
jgi:hypothetical protein